jgi:bifunctional DNA-binding transcriptional regulator/antitoxin component of YhaV-PrlF toxin-antitoxin module
MSGLTGDFDDGCSFGKEKRDERMAEIVRAYGAVETYRPRYGSEVNSQGQMQIPAEARKALGLETDTRLMVFAERSTRRLVVTIKPFDKDLLDLATRAVTQPKLRQM